jgi:uncharacterized repeat protein (TIGR01451 family)
MKNFITLILLFTITLVCSQTTPGEYTINNVKVNTKQSDFGTSFFGKDKVVFAAPRSNAVITRSTWSGNNQAFLDLYIATITKEGELEDKKAIIGDVNNRFHEGIVTFTKDMKTVYFSANNYTEKHKAKKDSTGTVNIQLYKAEVLKDGEWRNVVKLPFNNDEFSTGHPALSIDDKRLYFVSDRPETIGKTDIFYVDILDDGTYSQPINLGPKINTTEREMFPFVSDENILYFSSNGHEGYGELDVFASRIFDTTISEPINLENPVNSEKDDFSFIIDDTKHKGFFSSNREGGKGDDDIYGFYAFPPLKIEGRQVVTGIVRDVKTGEIISGATVILQDPQGNELQRVVLPEDASKGWQPFINDANSLTKDNVTVGIGDVENISISKTVDNEDPKVGDLVEFTVQLENAGTIDAENIKIADILPEGYTYVSDDASKTEGAALNSNMLSIKELSQGDVKTVKIKALIEPVWKPYTNDNKEVEKENIVVQTGDPDKVLISKTVNNEAPAEGEEVEFTVQLKNIGTIDAKNIKISDILPEGYTYVSDDAPNTKGAIYLNDIISVATLNKGEVKTIKVRAKVVPKEKNAVFKFDVASNKDYKIVVSAPGYLPEQVDFKTTNETDIKPLELPVKLSEELRVVDDKIMVNINTIYFDFDKWNIRPDAAKELDKVISIMKEHPSIIIEAGSHTDSRATEKYNQKLSQRRAQATVDYIVAGGIDRSRITAKGYGEMQLVNNCSSFVKCTREEHQLNRRTEFVIINDNERFASHNATLKDVLVGETNMPKVKQSDTKQDSDDLLMESEMRNYHIIVASLKNLRAARKKINQLRNKGYEAKILPADKSGAIRISLGGYDDREKALSDLYKIRRELEKSAWLLEQEVEEKQPIEKAEAISEQKATGELEEPAKEAQEDVKFSGEVVSKKAATKYVKIDPVYFAYDAWSLSKDELKQLDNLAAIMKENPTIKVEAGVHTDAKNKESYNLAFSQKRAKAVVDYIVSKGINSERIIGKGYGESRLTNHCRSFVKCTAEEQQANRRIEFMIIDGNGYPQQEMIDKESEKFIDTNPIYFDNDKYDIRKDAAYELDRVVRILKENPTMVIEAASHTDAKNTETYNQILSEKRAKSTKDYFVSKGINPSRIKTVGYGEKRLVNHCKSFVKCTPEEHQANRRTEFKIVNM